MVLRYMHRFAKHEDVKHFGPVSNSANVLAGEHGKDSLNVRQYDNPIHKETRNSRLNGLTHLSIIARKPTPFMGGMKAKAKTISEP